MLPLRDMQAAFRRALLAEDETALAALVEGGEARIDVHRNNFFASLGEVLRDSFPSVCRLVDERFFAYAAHEFIRRHPPERAVLAEYGGGFADFLADFPPCRHLTYLADVARLEWLMCVAATAADAAPLSAAALAGVAAEATPLLRLMLHPALGLLASPFPIDRIWRANRRGAVLDETPIDLAAGGIRLEISRAGSEMVMRALDAPGFAFRQALRHGGTLEAAATAALAYDPAFDLAGALGGLFREGAVIGVTHPSAGCEAAS
jgi:Putative DNA-binding domain